MVMMRVVQLMNLINSISACTILILLSAQPTGNYAEGGVSAHIISHTR